MPIFRDHSDDDDTRVAGAERPVSRLAPVYGLTGMRRQSPPIPFSRRASEESIRTDLCEGPLPDLPHPSAPEFKPEPGLVDTTSDRAELIEQLKRAQSPTWVPPRRVRLGLTGLPCPLGSTAAYTDNTPQLDSHSLRDDPRDHSPSLRPKSGASVGLLTASLAKEQPEAQRPPETDIPERMQDGLAIERPRSALHSGDFTQHAASSQYVEAGQQGRRIPDADVFRSDRQSSWFATSPPRHFVTPYKFEKRIPFPDLLDEQRASPPSVSSSLSSSFVYKHPTSPLVQSESNDDLNINAMDLDLSTPSRAFRRQTLHIFHSSYTSAPTSAQRIPNMRRQGTLPYQAHQPSKSLTSTPTFAPAGSLDSASPFSSRRSSIVLESSPLHQTSMVGSYEESILRGRMSTTPSKPLDFLAQIGVLGLGDCPSSLRFPAHVTLPFPAVFYSYANTPHGRSSSDDGPSPYVGQIDLENGLRSLEGSKARKRSHQRRISEARARREDAGSVDEGMDVEMTGVGVVGGPGRSPDARELAKQQRRRRGDPSSSSPKAPPGGSYRIPQKGQIQIIIKNQNKTAVKLFLVPYDLTGMEAGTKTFIRQRSYSGAEDNNKDRDKTVLRYLVHLHICCPAPRRYYLYKSVRVVFANRGPDGQEKLRNEITLPEPRWTPYKAVRQMPMPMQGLLGDQASRRRSMGFSLGQQGQQHGVQQQQHQQHMGDWREHGSGSDLAGARARASTFAAMPDRVSHEPVVSWSGAPGRPVGGGSGQPEGLRAPSMPADSGGDGAGSGFAPLNFAKGGFYGSNGGGDGGRGAGLSAGAEGLLSQRLRSLEMQGVCRGEMDSERETG